jgi:glycosidase
MHVDGIGRLGQDAGQKRARGVLVLACAGIVAAGAAGCDAFAGADPGGVTDEGLLDGAVGGDAPTLDAASDAPTPSHAEDAAVADVASVAPSDAAAPASDAAEAGPPAMDEGGIKLSACTTTFRYVPAAGQMVKKVQVAGEWGWGTPITMDGPDAQGAFTARVPLMPGLVAYKLILDGNWVLDPDNAFRKYVGGTENSGFSVPDCHKPLLSLASHQVTREAGGGHVTASVKFTRASGGGPALDPASVKVTLRHDGAERPLPPTMGGTSSAPTVDLDANGLADGKYTLFVDAADKAGAPALRLRLVFWVEAEPFDFGDGAMYGVVVDRFVDGDRGNDLPPTPMVDPAGETRGGDLAGVRAELEKGTFDRLGVRTLVLSPLATGARGAHLAADGKHSVTGFGGDWPVKAREVDSRFGGADALGALVTAAHARGLRVVLDVSPGSVDATHEYKAAHPDWFRADTCVCGTDKCEPQHRLDCRLADHLLDVDWTNPAVSTQFGADLLYWVDAFDLDGLRLLDLGHVEQAAAVNIAGALRAEFEAMGTKLLLTGETAVGWSDCAIQSPQCNAASYQTVASSIGPRMLDGQLDLVTYYAAPRQAFTADKHGMLHVEFWTEQAPAQYPRVAVMSPLVGDATTARFVSYASLQAAGTDAMSVADVPWNPSVVAPTSGDPYARLRTALAWLMTSPGAPFLFYGDEYGEWGGAAPGNQPMWRGAGTLSSDEQATLAFAQSLGAARLALPALRRGALGPLAMGSSEDVFVFTRDTRVPSTTSPEAPTSSNFVLVAVARATTATTRHVPLPAALGLADGTLLADRLGGPAVTVTAGAVDLALPPHGAALYAP